MLSFAKGSSYAASIEAGAAEECEVATVSQLYIETAQGWDSIGYWRFALT
jgi:hypothetical protein